MTPSKLYIIIVGLVFSVLTAVFLLLPRSEYSELEKRDLARFPEFSPEKLKGAKYTDEVSHWFSDTEPFRDEIMTFSMNLRDKIRLQFGAHEDAITFHAVDNGPANRDTDIVNPEIADYENHINAADNVKIASAGIFITGKVPNVRALNAFGGEASGGTTFAAVVSQYAREMPGVKVYAMVVPLSSEFYTPDKAKKSTKPQLPFIKNVYSHLTDGARGIDAYTPLGNHVEEDIYLRTDHHWAPLGAYYAAEAFAKAAGVPFKDLSSYERKVVHGYVGSMYGYSKDIAVKNSPEDFVYYVPKNVKHETTYRDYRVNSDYRVTSESAPAKGNFFYQYKDGSGGAYCTFMGGDQRLTHVHTGTANGRRLVIIKDSFGNPVPSYLFYSFEDIYVVDYRYFPHNLKNMIREKGITDVLFAVSVFNAYSPNSAEKMRKFLTQSPSSFASATSETPKENAAKPHPAVAEPQPATAEPQPAAEEPHPATAEPHPATEPQPATAEPQPATEPQPAGTEF